MSTTIRSSIRIAPCVLTAAVGACAGIAHAQKDGAGNDYCVTHTFRLTTPGTLPPDVFLVYKAHAFAKTNTCKDDQLDAGSISAGLGVTTRTVVALAPGSEADATSLCTITALGAGSVQGSFEVNGNANPTIAGCEPPAPPRGYGRGWATSTAQVAVHGRKLDKSGNIRYVGNWHNTGPISGGTGRSVGVDPVIAKRTDLTTGVTVEYTLLTIEATTGVGETFWSGGMLGNTSGDLVFVLSMGAPVTLQSGGIRIVAVGGVVTESSGTGAFSSLALPAVGSPSSFAVPLPELSIDYDLGGDPGHDHSTEFDFSNAGATEKDVTGDGESSTGNSLITDLGSGYDGNSISRPQTGDGTPGFDCTIGRAALAIPLVVAGPGPTFLEAVRWPVMEPGSAASAPLQGAYVRIWLGQPGAGGVVVAGDTVTNRLEDTSFSGIYRVLSNPLDQTGAIKDAHLDMLWAPPLAPGQYWLEVSARTQTGAGAWAPPAVWRGGNDVALQYNVQTGQWQPIHDMQSGRAMSIPAHIYTSHQQQACYANCDNSATPPVLNVLDFACFLNRFAAGDPYANCDGSTTAPALNVLDFACFLNRFAAGCP